MPGAEVEERSTGTMTTTQCQSVLSGFALSATEWSTDADYTLGLGLPIREDRQMKRNKYTLADKLHALDLAAGLAGSDLAAVLEGLGIPRSTYAFWRTRAAAGALDPRQPGRPPTESTRSRQLDRALGPVKEQLGRIIDILTEGEC